MAASVLLAVVAVGVLLVPESREYLATWVFSGVLLVLAGLRLLGISGSSAIQTARQVRYSSFGGYNSHDGSGDRDVSEKRGN